MATVLLHRGVRIVNLEGDEDFAEHCRVDDIAIRHEGDAWALYFIGEDGAEGYDQPYPVYDRALWTAKAAAEFAAE
ncbi:hypothetical protein [Massilia endophytica]|uniref:hypothetical protein n=1 Tax=Massilia endophytica TaxID=2899220 RepID=UPI001E3ABD71|nr:hypothetical protein [Massilia endophytica]UGQ48402.1 hypothetical protein LSQ66_08020 [Massilia endophytica]